MERKSAQKFVITLEHPEYMPFVYFLTLASLPVEMEDQWKTNPTTVKCSLTLPPDFDPLVLVEMWLEWRKDNLEDDYAILN